jgi:methylmalonyl-CoA/ethylmalonyl-CoA epimerase
MFPIGETYLELLESDKPDTGTSRWIAQHGEGLFHICLEVEDIDSAMAELRAKGIGFEQEKPMIGHGNCRIVFLDPKSTGNLVIELAELPKDGHGQRAAE